MFMYLSNLSDLITIVSAVGLSSLTNNVLHDAFGAVGALGNQSKVTP